MRERIMQSGCYVLAVGFGCEAAWMGLRLRDDAFFWPNGALLLLAVILGFLCLVGAMHFGREARERAMWRAKPPPDQEEWEA